MKEIIIDGVRYAPVAEDPEVEVREKSRLSLVTNEDRITDDETANLGKFIAQKNGDILIKGASLKTIRRSFNICELDLTFDDLEVKCNAET
jgi:hypothetical protein